MVRARDMQHDRGRPSRCNGRVGKDGKAIPEGPTVTSSFFQTQNPNMVQATLDCARTITIVGRSPTFAFWRKNYTKMRRSGYAQPPSSFKLTLQSLHVIFVRCSVHICVKTLQYLKCTIDLCTPFSTDRTGHMGSPPKGHPEIHMLKYPVYEFYLE